MKTRKRALLALILLATTGVGTVAGSDRPAAAAPGAPVDLSPQITGEKAIDGGPVISADGSRVVYMADDGVNVGLWSVPIGGGTPIRLDGASGDSHDVVSFVVSPTQNVVAYLADEEVDGKDELYLAHMANLAPKVKLSGPLGLPSGDVWDDYIFSPNGLRVVYRVDRNFDGVFDLYSANPVSNVALNVGFAAGESTREFTVSPDSANVVFTAHTGGSGLRRLYSVPIAGGVLPKQLSDDPAHDGDVLGIAVSIDNRVVYGQDHDTDDRYELYAVDMDGSDLDEISAPIGAEDVDVDEGGFLINVDGSRVVYRTDPDEGDSELVSVAIDGSDNFKIAEFAGASTGRDVLSFRLSPFGDKVAYVADTAGAAFDAQLFQASIYFDAIPDELLDPMFAGARIEPPLYATENDILALAERGINSFGLYSVDIAGVEEVSPPLPAGRTIGDVVRVAPGDRFIYSADFQGESPSAEALLLESLAPGAQLQPLMGYTNPPHPSISIERVSVSSDSKYVVYTSDPDLDGFHHVYSVQLDVPLPPPPGGGGAGGGGGSGGAGGAVLGSSFVGFEPVRVFDSRPGELPETGPKGLVGPNAGVDVHVTGAATGVPDNATAVVMNVTGTNASGPGFLTIHEAGTDRPLASSLNLTAPNQTRANTVVMPFSASGDVTIYSQSGADVIVDVTGYFVPTNVGVSAGRLLPLETARVFDTRASEPAPGPKGLVPAGGTIDVQVGGVAGVPADATAAVLTVVATETTRAGYVTVFAGDNVPLASNLNINAAGETVPNLVIAPLRADGTISVYTQSAAHLLADVTGYITGSSATASDAGLFIPNNPERLFDTRPDQLPIDEPKGELAAGETITLQVSGRAGLPDHIGLVLLNLTGVDADTGYVTGYPSDQPQPLASALNLNGPGDTRAIGFITPVSAAGRLNFYAQNPAQLLADSSGYFTP